MSEIEQLTAAIEIMGRDQQASEFVHQQFQADNFAFLRYLGQILNIPTISVDVMKNSVTLISVILTPSIMRPVASIAENYYLISDEEREQIKTAVLRGLLLDDYSTRNNFAYCLALIIYLEYTHDGTLFRNPIFSTYLFELIDKSPTESAPVGAVMAITHIFTVLPPFRLLTKATTFLQGLIKGICDKVLKSSDVNDFVIMFKSECCKLLLQALKHRLLESIFSADGFAEFCELILPNLLIPNQELFKQILALLTEFVLTIYMKQGGHLSENLVEVFSAILAAIAGPFSAIKSEGFDALAMEDPIKAIMRMLTKISKFEARNLSKIDPESSLTLLSINQLGEFLFYYLSTINIQEYFQDDQNSLARNAFDTLSTFSKVHPLIIFQQALQLFASEISSQDPTHIFVALVSGQLALDITFDENSAQVFQALLPMTQSDNALLAGMAFTVLGSAFYSNERISQEKETFAPMLEAIFHVLSRSTDTSLLNRVLQAFQYLIKHFNQTDITSNLADFYSQITEMLFGFIKRPDLQGNNDVLPTAYSAIGSYISKLPQSFPPDPLFQLATSVQNDMTQLMEQQSLQILCWYSYIVRGIAQKFTEEQIVAFSPQFFAILTRTLELIESSDADITQNEYILHTISVLLMKSGETSNPFVPSLLEIAKKSLSTQNPLLIQTAALMVGDIFSLYGANLLDSIHEMIGLLYNSLLTHATSPDTISQILYSISRIISYDFIDAYQLRVEDPASIMQLATNLGESLSDIRKELMDISANIIPFLSKYAKEEFCEHLFYSILSLFSAMMDLYLYETTPNPDNTGHHLPSPFIAEYQSTFVELIKQGEKYKIISEHILQAFLNFLLSIITQFDTALSMNLKIHNLSFEYYLKGAKHNDNLKNKWKIVEHAYSRA